MALFNDTYSEPSYRDSLYIVIPVTVMYASIFLTGIIGNVSTCIVIARNKSMHTATNYYLFSLAVSDLLLLVSGLPAEMYLVWCKYPYIFGEGFCVLRGLASETSANASVLTIAAFTVERYVAICHPFLSQTLSKLSRAIKLILVIWLVALSFALPQALQFGVVRHTGNPDMVMCTVKRIIISHSFELSTFLFFVMPMCLITVLYALIGLKLRKSNMMKNVRVESTRRHHPGRSSRRVLKMLVAVVIAFFICWAPFHVQRLIAIYGTNTEDHITSNGPWMEFLYLLMTYVSGVLYYVSTTINPILYNIMSNKFRMAFMETLSRSCRLPGLQRHEQRSYSSLSRSQQRTIGGAYNSKTAGTIGRGSGMVADSTDGSANSETACPRNNDGRIAGNRQSRNLAVPRYVSADTSDKKWWLKWLPGLKVLGFSGRPAEDESAAGRREELPMTMWNRPV
ncbi:PREDICTED: neuromedin-U receptor 2-like [Dinoponera quadriceps]|uniref:Neuromedin-U receptor 2-like n=1 Tax=Dinoponera quadriceps TaxID=609295 RepID=A0A6P3XBP7_DINQU|nr:PREDICTED: neuromedin-U receptor 2-like [Dinoponera quadriceps]